MQHSMGITCNGHLLGRLALLSHAFLLPQHLAVQFCTCPPYIWGTTHGTGAFAVGRAANAHMLVFWHQNGAGMLGQILVTYCNIPCT